MHIGEIDTPAKNILKKFIIKKDTRLSARCCMEPARIRAFLFIFQLRLLYSFQRRIVRVDQLLHAEPIDFFYVLVPFV